MTSFHKPGRAFRITLMLTLFAGVLIVTGLTLANEAAAAPAWKPKASERLIKLPGNYLEKALDHDFARSELAEALTGVEGQIGLKTETLGDLQAAVGQAEDEVETELRHQFLVEKKAYIEMMGERLSLRRKHVETKKRVYQKLLKKLAREKAGNSSARAELVEKQTAAYGRFERTLASVDMKLFASDAAPRSRYAEEYAKNMSAIEQLVVAIKDHPMAQGPELDGRAVTKEEFLRQLVQSTETELAIMTQEETILGYMAKLVALDAMALSDEVLAADDDDDDFEDEDDMALTSAVDFFTSN